MSFGAWSVPVISTLTAPAATGEIVAAGADRAFLTLTNLHAGRVWLALGGDAVVNEGWYLDLGDTLQIEPGLGADYDWLRGAVHAVSADGGPALMAAQLVTRPGAGEHSGTPGVRVVRSFVGRHGEVAQASSATGVDTAVQRVQHVDQDGAVQPAGDDPSRAIYVQGAGHGTPGALMTFGDPAAAPPHSTAISGDIAAAAAQAEAIACPPPATGKVWQTLQVMLRWTVAPGAPVAGTPDLYAMVYWTDGAYWWVQAWPAKYLAAGMDMADFRDFGAIAELPFPKNAVAFAVGCGGYVGGELYVDLIPGA